MKPVVLLIAVGVLLGAGGVTAYLLMRADAPAQPGPGTDPDALKLPQPYGFDTPDTFRVGFIAVGHGKAGRNGVRTREQAARLIADIHKSIKTGVLSFGDAARQFSDAPSAQQGGDLGFVTFQSIANLPGSSVVMALKPGEMSHVIEREDGFFIYTRIPYERRYYRVLAAVRYGRGATDLLSEGEARTKAYESYTRVTSGGLDPDGPDGYVGEIVPGSKGEAFDRAVAGLTVGEVSSVFTDGLQYLVVQRCKPIQFTFSFIVFPGIGLLDNDGEAPRIIEDRAKPLRAQAEAALTEIAGSRERFYAFALKHYHDIKWEGPWYKVSKDLYKNKLERPIYDFLAKARPGDISEPFIFDNGVYVLIKEEFIPPE